MKKESNMKIVNDPLFTQKYTKVLMENEEDWKYNAPHNFQVINAETEEPILEYLNFQCGPIKECGVNGVSNEDLLLMVLLRLRAFQKSEFSCRENAIAITKLEESLMWLRRRTDEREFRNVEGTNQV